MNHKQLITAVFFIITSIIIGAFGAHGLKSKISPESINILHTATQYLMYNGLGLMAIFGLRSNPKYTIGVWPGRLIILGTLLFSGSIVLLAVRSIFQIIPLSILGPTTPIGGTLLIAGWIFLLINLIISNRQ